MTRTQDPDGRIVEPADRVEALRALLLACRDGGAIVVQPQLPAERWRFEGSFDTPLIVLRLTVRILVEPLPSGWVQGDARIEYRGESGPSKGSELERLGWSDEVSYTRRVFELDPDDPAAVASMIDAIRAAYATCGMTEDPAWRIAPAMDDPGTTGLAGRTTAPRGGRWTDPIGQGELREAIRRMAGLRGGSIQVRRAVGPSPQIDLIVRRKRGTIEVSPAHAAPTGVRSFVKTVHLDPAFLDVGPLFENLEDALASRAEPGVAPALSIRENLDELSSTSTGEGEGYLLIFLWIPTGLLLLATGTFAVPLESDVILWLPLGMMALAPWSATRWIGGRLAWRMATVEKAAFGVLLVAAIVLDLLPLLLPSAWRAAGGVTWVIAGLWVAFAVVRWLGRWLLRG